MYCTPDAIRAAVGDGSLDLVVDAVLEAAASDAVHLVDRFTGRFFGQQTRALVLDVSASGRADLPVEPSITDPLSILAVAVAEDPNRMMSPNLYRYIPATFGGQSHLSIGADAYGYNMLVRGAEPWNGGYAGLYRRTAGRSQRVIVTGTFGLATIPTAVQTAAAALAVISLGKTPGNVSGGQSLANVKSISEEGYSVTFENPEPLVSGRNLRTTGNPAADLLLAPYVIEAPGVSFR